MIRIDNTVTTSELNKLKSIICEARKQYKKAQQLENKIFDYLDSIGIGEPSDISPVTAENADNLADGISCYLNYGEWSPEGIIKTIEDNYNIVDDSKT